MGYPLINCLPWKTTPFDRNIWNNRLPQVLPSCQVEVEYVAAKLIGDDSHSENKPRNQIWNTLIAYVQSIWFNMFFLFNEITKQTI